MVEQRSSKPFAWVRFLLPLFIKSLFKSLSKRHYFISKATHLKLTNAPSPRTTNQLPQFFNKTQSTKRKQSFLHPNQSIKIQKNEARLSENVSLRSLNSAVQSGLRYSMYKSERRNVSRISRYPNSQHRQHSSRRLTQLFKSPHFSIHNVKNNILLKSQPYVYSHANNSQKLFFKMFSYKNTLTLGLTTPFRPENSFFWKTVSKLTKFGPQTRYLEVLFGDDMFLQIRKNGLLPSVFLTQNYANLNLIEPSNWLVKNSLSVNSTLYLCEFPSTYSLKLSSDSFFMEQNTSLFLKNLVGTNATPFRPFSNSYEIDRVMAMLCRRLDLQRFNLTLKKSYRRLFSFFMYKVPPAASIDRKLRQFIPELPLALRGSFWTESIRDSNLTVSDFWQNDNCYELKRNSTLRLSTTLFRNRLKSNQPLKDKSTNFEVNVTQIFLSRKTHKHFRHVFYENSDCDYSESDDALIKTDAYLDILEKGSLKSYQKRGLILNNVFDNVITPDDFVNKGYSSEIKELNTYTDSVEKNEQKLETHQNTLSKFHKLNFWLVKKVRRIIRIRTSLTKRRMNQKQRFGRLAIKTATNLGRIVSQQLKISKSVKYLWRRINKYSSRALSLSANRFKKIKSFKTLKAENKQYTQVSKLFKIRYSNSYKHVLDSLLVKQAFESNLTDSVKPTSVSELPIYTFKTNPISCYDNTLSTYLTSIGSHLPSLLKVWSSPVLIKYAILRRTFNINCTQFNSNPITNSGVHKLQNQISTFYFGLRSDQLRKLNVWNFQSSNLVLRKRLLRVSSRNIFSPTVTMWYYRSLVRFIENCTGRRVALHFGPFVEGVLTFEDRAYLSMWSGRVIGFQKILGHRIFVQEALTLIAISIRLKDPTFLANWIRGMLKRLSFWKYRLIFRYVKYVVLHLFKSQFSHFQFKGFKLRLKGKISVAGNARTRTLWLKIGDTSHSKMDNKIAYDLSYVGTFTGALGFKLWFFY